MSARCVPDAYPMRTRYPFDSPSQPTSQATPSLPRAHPVSQLASHSISYPASDLVSRQWYRPALRLHHPVLIPASSLYSCPPAASLHSALPLLWSPSSAPPFRAWPKGACLHILSPTPSSPSLAEAVTRAKCLWLPARPSAASDCGWPRHAPLSGLRCGTPGTGVFCGHGQRLSD